MDGLLPRVVLDGLGIALSPISVMVAIGLLGTHRPVANSYGFVVGWMGHLALLCLLFLLVLHGHRLWGVDLSRPLSILLLVMGLVLLALGVRTWRDRAGGLGEIRGWLRRLDRLSPRLAVVAGFLAVSFNAKNAALTLSTVHGLESVHPGAGESIAVATSGVAAPVAVHLALPGRSSSMLQAWQGWLARYSLAVVTWVLLGAGSLLTITALLTLRG